MEIIVCVKQVPGTSQVEVDPETGVLRRDGVESKLNPYDLFAIEYALRLCQAHGGRVRALTMGPPQAESALREAMHMGAHGAVLLTDRRFAGADVLATSLALAQGVAAMGAYDLILCGKQTTDGDTAQVGPELAEILGVPHAANVLSVEPDGHGALLAEVGLDKSVQRQLIPMPCLLTVEKDVCTPRLPSYRRMKELRGADVTVLTLEDCAAPDPMLYGLNGSPTKVERIFPPEAKTERRTFTGDGETLAAAVTDILVEGKYI